MYQASDVKREATRAWAHYAHGADIGVRGFGETAAEAFANAARAMTAAITDLAAVHETMQVPIQCSAPDLDGLLFDWLNAVVYEMATRRALFARFEVTISGHTLKATAHGEPIDVARHAPAVEIKGATFTDLAVREEPNGRIVAQCIVDV